MFGKAVSEIAVDGKICSTKILIGRIPPICVNAV